MKFKTKNFSVSRYTIPLFFSSVDVETLNLHTPLNFCYFKFKFLTISVCLSSIITPVIFPFQETFHLVLLSRRLKNSISKLAKIAVIALSPQLFCSKLLIIFTISDLPIFPYHPFITHYNYFSYLVTLKHYSSVPALSFFENFF